MTIDFLTLIDVTGTFAFAVSGAYLAIEKKLDPFGVFVLSFVTAIGGGTLRDVMIGRLPVGWLTNTTAIMVICVGALGTMLFTSRIKKLTSALFIFDALGLGLFTIVGIELGIGKSFSIGVSIALGTITASFGGVIRDVLLNRVPLVFQKEIYALASILGGFLYFGFIKWNMEPTLAKIICILLIFMTRVLSVKYSLSLPIFYKK